MLIQLKHFNRGLDMQTMWTTSTRDDDYFKKLQKQAKARIVVTLTEMPTYK